MTARRVKGAYEAHIRRPSADPETGLEGGGDDLDLDAPPASAFVFGDPVVPAAKWDPWPR